MMLGGDGTFGSGPKPVDRNPSGCLERGGPNRYGPVPNGCTAIGG